jgi:hypothetical protein
VDIQAQLNGFSKSLRPAFAGITFTLKVYHYPKSGSGTVSATVGNLLYIPYQKFQLAAIFRKRRPTATYRTTTRKTVVVPFGILERISIRSYVFATVGTVERPFPAKTHHYPKNGYLDLLSTFSYIFERIKWFYHCTPGKKTSLSLAPPAPSARIA